MVAVGLRQRGPPADGGRGCHVALAVGVRHVRVAAGVQAVHGYRKRHRGNRVGETVLLRQFVGAAAHQVKRRRAADVLTRAVRQGEHARLRDDPRRRDHGTPAGCALRKFRPAGRPGREVPARTVPDRHYPGTVHRQRREQVDPSGHVRERPRPASSGERPPVLQVPRGVPAPCEIRRQGPPK